MKEHIVLAEGTKVLALGQIEGVVTQILIQNGAIEYGVAWVTGSDVKSGMFNGSEVKPVSDEHKKVRIGFHASIVK